MSGLVQVRRLLIPSNVVYVRAACSSGFKSAYSIDKIHPGIDPDINVNPKVPDNADGKFSGYIPIKQLGVSYSKSGGAGGQNVNKVNTKVELRFHVQTASWLPEDAKQGLLKKYRSRISRDGYLSVKSERTRSQHLNKADALDRIRFLVVDVLQKPKEVDLETLERHRRLHERAVRERLKEKRSRSLHRQQQEIVY